MKIDNFSLWSGMVQDVPGKGITQPMAKPPIHT